MKRITKYEPSEDSNFPYKLVNNELGTELNAIHQLGRFEDLMQEYNINSIQELEDILSSKFITGGSRSGGKSIVAKGMLYNKLSEEIGCPSEIIFKALEEDIIDAEGSRVSVCLEYIQASKEWLLIGKFCRTAYYVSDYQKTWWLKGEKYEKL